MLYKNITFQHAKDPDKSMPCLTNIKGKGFSYIKYSSE